MTELINAIKENDIEKVKHLINAGVNIDTRIENRDEYYRTPILMAVLHQHTDIVQLLIDNNADIDARDYARRTALTYTALNGNTKIAQLLIDKNADVNVIDGYDWNILMYAFANQYTEIAELLIKAGADIDAKNINGISARMVDVAKRKQIELNKKFPPYHWGN